VPELDDDQDLRHFDVPSLTNSTSPNDDSGDRTELPSRILAPVNIVVLDTHAAHANHSTSDVSSLALDASQNSRASIAARLSFGHALERSFGTMDASTDGAAIPPSRFGFAHALERVAANSRSSPVPEGMGGSPATGLLRVDCEDDNPFAPSTPSRAPQHVAHSPSPPHFLSPGPIGAGGLGAESTPSRPSRDRAGLRASAMLRSGGPAANYASPVLRQKRSVAFRSPAPSSHDADTSGFARGLARVASPPPPRTLRHKRSLLDPLASATSSVRRSLSRHFKRAGPASSSTPARREGTPPPLPPLPPGVERIGAGLGFTSKKTPRGRAPRMKPSMTSLRAGDTTVQPTPARGLLRRLVSKTWGRKALASVRKPERSVGSDVDNSLSTTDLEALRRELMGERVGEGPRPRRDCSALGIAC
jgi:hypothetical protein